MKFAEILIIKKALMVLGQERLPVAYEIAKNIRICDKIITESKEIANEVYLRYADREENGDVKMYKNELGQGVARITDSTRAAECQVELNKLDLEEHDVSFVKFNKNILKAEKLSADTLIPLIDIIIVEE